MAQAKDPLDLDAVAVRIKNLRRETESLMNEIRTSAKTYPEESKSAQRLFGISGELSQATASLNWAYMGAKGIR